MKHLFLVVSLFAVSCAHLKEIDNPVTVDVGRSEFIFMGDTGTGQPDQYKVADGIKNYCKGTPCNFGLLLGDNIYNFGVEDKKVDPQFQSKFEAPYKELPFKFYVALGNHDHYGDWKGEVEYSSPHWSMPDRYYIVSSQYANIYVLDTEKMTDEQAVWLDKALALNTKPWTIVIGHHPVYSSGLHGDTRSMKKKILPILMKHQVDFYLSGHDHDQEIIESDKIVFVVAGAGSKIRNTKTPSNDTLWIKSALGFSHLSVTQYRSHLSMLADDGSVLFEKNYEKSGKRWSIK